MYLDLLTLQKNKTKQKKLVNISEIRRYSKAPQTNVNNSTWKRGIILLIRRFMAAFYEFKEYDILILILTTKLL